MFSFTPLADQWWDPKGPFRALQRLGALRMRYIFRTLQLNTEPVVSLKDWSILDVGCGGGLMTEPLSRLGAHVVGMDCCASALHVAHARAVEQNLPLRYIAGTLDCLQPGPQFDVILTLDVLEHVLDPFLLCRQASALLKPNGWLIAATLNRTARAYFLGILAAEHLLKWAPVGAHQWEKFIQPAELSWWLTEAGFHAPTFQGFSFNWLQQKWVFSSCMKINYFAAAQKPGGK